MKINLLDIPIFYINMAKDIEKKKYLESKLKSLGFKNITRIDAVVANPGIVGLSMSQNIALNMTEAPFIILEDDCDPQNFVAEIEVPDDADAVYLGNSPWGSMNSHHGMYLQYSAVKGYPDMYRIYNMLSSHAILYLTQDYVNVCKRTTNYCATVSKTVPMDVPFAEIQKFYNVYVFEKPHFVQKDYGESMGHGPRWTNKYISRHRPSECMKYNASYFRPYKITD
jgi:hypothetical protein